MMLESANLPLRLERYDGPSRGLALARREAGSRAGAAARGERHARHARRPRARRPLVNGDSGFIPRAFDRAMELFEHGLDARGPALPARRGRAPRRAFGPELARAPGRRPRGGPLRARDGAGGRTTARARSWSPPASRRPRAASKDWILVEPGRAARRRADRLRARGRAVARAPARRGLARRRPLGAARRDGEPRRRHAVALFRPAPRARRDPLRPATAAPASASRRSCRRARARSRWGSSR